MRDREAERRKNCSQDDDAEERPAVIGALRSEIVLGRKRQLSRHGKKMRAGRYERQHGQDEAEEAEGVEHGLMRSLSGRTKIAASGSRQA
jgi:hypothetical protein